MSFVRACHTVGTTATFTYWPNRARATAAHCDAPLCIGVHTVAFVDPTRVLEKRSRDRGQPMT
ncbi:MAG: hypothetical protein K0U78_14430 [Actinomycetia bacterium]|nr:hypothetical protein [Actinomycetes bacterium]